MDFNNDRLNNVSDQLKFHLIDPRDSEAWEAYVFAEAAHGAINHKRKMTGEDYIVHPVEVADIAAKNNLSFHQVCAGFLHDTIEDTHVTQELIERCFTADVARYTVGMTDPYRDPKVDGNNATRSQKNAEHMWAQSKAVQDIKCCDMIANLRSLEDGEIDVSFIKYINENLEHKLSGMADANYFLGEQVTAWLRYYKEKYELS